MSYDNESNHVSVLGWMFMMFVTAIPVVGWIMILVWAFMGGNQTRKNYFRAMLAWFVILFAVGITVAVLGGWPAIQKDIQGWTHKT